MYEDIGLIEARRILATAVDREVFNLLAIERFASERWEGKMRKMSKPALIRFINQQIESENTFNNIVKLAKGD